MRRWWLVAWVVLLLGQLWMLYTPNADDGPGFLDPVWDMLRPLPGPTAPGEPGFDKLVHALAFFAVTAVGLKAGLPRWLAIGLPAVHAPVSELIQLACIEGRGGEWWDLAADWAGVAVAALLLGRRPTRRRDPG